jgi:hypothetical protein
VTATISAWLRRGAIAVAAGRVAIGVVALTAPPLIARPWIGPAAGSAEARVLARALGGRDLALGLGALTALLAPEPGTGSPVPAAGSAGVWVGAAAVADALDALATAASWRKLPASRWLVALSAAGAAALGAAASWSLVAREAADGS